VQGYASLIIVGGFFLVFGVALYPLAQQVHFLAISLVFIFAGLLMMVAGFVKVLRS